MSESVSRKQEKLAVSFHRTFPFSREAISQILRLAGEQNEQPETILSYEFLRERTTLGTVYIEAMPRYARAAGFFAENGPLTRFGELVIQDDVNLARADTQWLVHYHLSAPHRPGPVFWGNLVSRCLRIGETIEPAALVVAIAEAQSTAGLAPVSENTLSAAATVFIRTYSREDALGYLGIIRESGTAYEVCEPSELDWRVFAYVLADYWDGVWRGLRTVDLETVVSEAGGPASLLFQGVGQAGRLLREMQAEGLIQIQRRVAPYQVVRQWPDDYPFLERIYAEE